MAAILTNTADSFSDPHRVAAEQLVVLWSTQMTRHTQMQHEIVYDFLRFTLSHQTSFDVALEIDVEESRGTAKAHRGTVLLLNSSKVCKVKPLNGFFGILCRMGNIKAIGSGHCNHVIERLDLVGQLLRTANLFFGGGNYTKRAFIFLLFLN